MTASSPLVESSLPIPLLRRGKVREVYEVDDATLLLVASDRISAFDIVLDQPIPSKGAVLTQISAYWFRELAGIVPSHYITADAAEIVERVPALQGHEEAIAGRAMLAHWKEYKQSGTLAGEPLPEGLQESDRFDPPIFSPATKAEEGHDENVTYDHVVEALGSDLAARLKQASLDLYSAGRERAAERGLIIADTKFEFGHRADGELLVIDEILTPDSSRFWPADDYEPGRGQKSFDKQPMRDYLASLKAAGEWDGEPPAPPLSPETVEVTSARYREAFQRITGSPLPEFG